MSTPRIETNASCKNDQDESLWIESDSEAHDFEARWQRVTRKRHWTMLGVSLAVIVLAFSMRRLDESRVAFRFLPAIPAPELCGSRLLFDTSCPGCGLTRSLLALAEGDWETSLRYHRIGWIMALAIVLQIPYRIYRLREKNPSRIPPRWPTWAGSMLIALLIANWLTNLFQAF